MECEYPVAARYGFYHGLAQAAAQYQREGRYDDRELSGRDLESRYHRFRFPISRLLTARTHSGDVVRYWRRPTRIRRTPSTSGSDIVRRRDIFARRRDYRSAGRPGVFHHRSYAGRRSDVIDAGVARAGPRNHMEHIGRVVARGLCHLVSR